MQASRNWIGRLARFGLACRGVVYLVVAVLAVDLVRGRAQPGQADTRGALQTISQHPFGHALVLAIAVGFGCLAFWQAALAARSWPGSDGRRRLAAAGKAVVDITLAFTALAIAAHHRVAASGDKEAVDVTARLMRGGTGRFAVGAVGLGIGVVGVGLIVKGLRKRYDVEVHINDVPAPARRVFEAIGGFGMLARGLIVALIGFFVLQAAVTFDPAHARGVDGVLAMLVRYRWGPALLGAIAAGLACFGVFSILEARYARV